MKTLFTAFGMLGYAWTQDFWFICLLAVPLGLGGHVCFSGSGDGACGQKIEENESV